MALDIVIMAAGKGTRMKSDLPKVLHTLAGSPLLGHVLCATAALGQARVFVVTGHGAEAVERYVETARPDARCVRQVPQRGTGHAVQQVAPLLADGGTTLILNGDVPLIEADTAHGLVRACAGKALVLLTAVLPDATGYGRIERDAAGRVRGIVEHKDASESQRLIREVYSGMMAVPTTHLKRWLSQLRCDNAQGEYYLTDIVAMAAAEGVPLEGLAAADATEILGVNSPRQLHDLERLLQRRTAERLMDEGVRLADASRLDIRGTLQAGPDVFIDVGCVFEGAVSLGAGVRIGAHCVIRDAVIEAGTEVLPFTHIEGARVGAESRIGPFSRLRPGTELAEQVHIGNFVELKASTMGRGAKANHLAYLGDATVGERVNFGAGSITANYDGARKHRTVIEDDVHVGSNCVLVAPVRLGAGGTLGAGSTVSRDTGPGELTVARPRQSTIPGWSRPRKGA